MATDALIHSTDGKTLSVGMTVYFAYRKDSWKIEKARVKRGVVIQLWPKSRTVRVRFENQTERKWTPELSDYERLSREPWNGCFATPEAASRAAEALNREHLDSLLKAVAKAKEEVADFRKILAQP